jgi:hypothetical protein
VGIDMTKFVPDALRKAADLYEERNKLYSDNYKHFGAVMNALFPTGIAQRAGVDDVRGETKSEYYNRVGVLIQIVSKLTRYCANFERGGHSDSLHDMAVYAMMLDELDQGVKPDIQEECDRLGIDTRTFKDN